MQMFDHTDTTILFKYLALLQAILIPYLLQKKKAVEKIVGRGDNGVDQPFLLFPQSFPRFRDYCSRLHNIFNFSSASVFKTDA